ncbi:MAG: hypothetical protein JST43_02005 [Bacteroidetes bacterium]|nr:hypothetical protein [Bacteroidota bacterium]MBS1539431.1 hypothetical protein [Bacteroidota bacterium]
MNAFQDEEINLWDLLLTTIRFLLAKRKLIVVCLTLGLLAGIAHYFITPKVYESKSMWLSSFLQEPQVQQSMEVVNKFIKGKNTPALAGLLSLEEKEASQIKAITFEYIHSGINDKNDKKEKTELTTSDLIIVRVMVLDNSILPKLQTGLAHYLEDNNFVKLIIEKRKETLRALISKLDTEIHSLDSMKTSLFKDKTSTTKNNGMVLVDPSNIYGSLVNLYRERLDYKNELDLISNIQLLEGFAAFEKPVSPKLLKDLAFGLLGGVAFSIMSLVFSALSREL